MKLLCCGIARSKFCSGVRIILFRSICGVLGVCLLRWCVSNCFFWVILSFNSCCIFLSFLECWVSKCGRAFLIFAIGTSFRSGSRKICLRWFCSLMSMVLICFLSFLFMILLSVFMLWMFWSICILIFSISRSSSKSNASSKSSSRKKRRIVWCNDLFVVWLIDVWLVVFIVNLIIYILLYFIL